MKFVIHDISLRDALTCCIHKSCSYIHGHCLDRLTLVLAQRLHQIFSYGELSFFDQVQHPRASYVGQNSHVAVAFLRTFFIDSQIVNAILASSELASFYRADRDGINRAPRQARELTNALGARANLEQLNDKTGHQCAHAAVALSPGYDQLLAGTVGVLELRHTGLDKRLKLTSIQVPPFAISPAVDMRAFNWISWVSPDLPLLQNDLNDYALVFER